ncbi:hypothetical protein MTF69_21765 [Streptomyces sp. AP-93]|nr:hypothetical protein [Streptomyces sp. AP-93]
MSIPCAYPTGLHHTTSRWAEQHGHWSELDQVVVDVANAAATRGAPQPTDTPARLWGARSV